MILFQNTITLYDMKVIITRMFSHEGSRRGKMFGIVVCTKLYRMKRVTEMVISDMVI